jgi:hypothetical protein
MAKKKGFVDGVINFMEKTAVGSIKIGTSVGDSVGKSLSSKKKSKRRN